MIYAIKHFVIFASLIMGSVTAQASLRAEESNDILVIEAVHPLTPSQLNRLQKKYQLRDLNRLSPYSSEYFDRVYRAKAPQSVIELLKSDELVRDVELSQTARLQSVNDPLFSYQWGLHNTGYTISEDLTDIRSHKRVGVPGMDIGWLEAREELENHLTRDVRVAVVDSGVDYEHEELVNQLYKNEIECVNGRIPLGVAKDDHDGNGYKGDCIGINLVAANDLQKNRPLDETEVTDTSYEGLGHGTHIAGIMAATPDNGYGISGLSNRIKILPIKVISRRVVEGMAPITDRVAEAILYAISREVDVINLSLGWPSSQNTKHVREAIQEAKRKGIFVVAAAGNNSHGGPLYPCAFDGVICVASATVDGKLSSFSNYGPHVDIVAPGSRILSLYPKVLIPQFFSAKGFEIKSGTSQAAPFVSGVLALLRGAFPDESAEEIRLRVLASADRSILKDKKTGGGLLRLDASLLGKKHRQHVISFKETNMALVKDGQVTLSLPLESIPGAASPVSVDVQSESSHVQVTNVSTEHNRIEIRAQVKNLRGHSEWDFQLRVGDEEFVVRVPLVRAAVKPSRTYQLPENVEPGQLRTVYSFDGGTSEPYYFKVSKVGKEVELEIFRLDQDRLTSLFKRVLTGETHFMGAGSYDLNDDGNTDFIAYTFHYEQAEDSRAQLLRLSLHYFDINGRGLVNGHGQLRLADDQNVYNVANLLNFNRVSFVPFTLPSGETIRTPTLMDNGYRPTVDRSKLEKRQGSSISPHIYFLEPVEQDGQVRLRTRVADSAKFEEEVRKKLGLYYYDELRPLFHIIQSRELAAAGIAQYLMMAGQDEVSKTLLVKIKRDGKTDWEVVNPEFGMHGYLSTPVWDLTLGSQTMASTAVYGFVAMYSLDGAFWNSAEKRFQSTFQLSHPDTTEDIARLLQVFEKDGEKYIVFETSTLLNVLHVNREGRSSLRTASIHRSSFFGQLFSQIASAIAIRSPNGLNPGLYIDNSQIHARSVMSWELDSDELIAPIDLTMEVPEGCRTLNPVMIENTYYYAVTCKDTNEISYYAIKSAR